MDANAAKATKYKNANFKTLFLMFLSFAIFAFLNDRMKRISGTATIICTCFPLASGYGRPLLKNIIRGFILGTAAAIIFTVVGLFFGKFLGGYLIYSLFCGILLLCAFGCLLRFMPERYASRTVSLLFMYISLAGAAA